MTAFHFGLQKVLELRKKSENESARGLAEARGEAEAARKAKADLEAAREAGRSRLVDAHGSFRERKTIEDLRSRRHDKWRVDEERGEQKDMDEIALVRHSRAEQGVSGGGT